jgi:hypothetical protein
MVRLVLVAASAALLGCGAAVRPPAPPDSTGPRLAGIEGRLKLIDERLERIDVRTGAPRVESWSCAAKCVSKYTCHSSGNSTVTWKTISSHGATAAATFLALQDKCEGDPLVTAHCADGRFVQQSATIVNACAKN